MCRLSSPRNVQTQQPAAEAAPLNMCLSHAAAGRHQADSTGCFKQTHTAAAHSRALQFIYMVYYIDRLSYDEPSLHLWH
ncbi:hypothetical protein STEG23_009511 [Scotinomys teguina]